MELLPKSILIPISTATSCLKTVASHNQISLFDYKFKSFVMHLNVWSRSEMIKCEMNENYLAFNICQVSRVLIIKNIWSWVLYQICYLKKKCIIFLCRHHSNISKQESKMCKVFFTITKRSLE